MPHDGRPPRPSRRLAGCRMRQRRNGHVERVLRRRADDLPPADPDARRPSLLPLPGRLHQSLLAKYEELSKKYEVLVHKYEDASVEETGVYQLGWWALRTSASALALVRGGSICLTNHR